MLSAGIKIYSGMHHGKLWTFKEKTYTCTLKYEFLHLQHESTSYSLHTCRLPASCLLCVCDRDVECVCATLLRPIWRALNLYRFPFPGLCFPSLELRHAAMQPPPSSPCNTISPINSSPFKTHNRMTNKRTLCALCCRAPRQNSQTVTLKIGEVLIAPLMETD